MISAAVSRLPVLFYLTTGLRLWLYAAAVSRLLVLFYLSTGLCLRPYGTHCNGYRYPRVKTRGYLHLPLRGKKE